MSRKQDDKPTSGPGKVRLALGALTILLAGAGATYGAFQMGLFGQPAAANEPDKPLLIRKGDEDPYAPAPIKEGPGGEEIFGSGGSEYRTLYFSFEEGFTANLKDSPGLIQVSLAASTHHDGRVVQWLHAHELAIRSAVLVELANTGEDAAYSIEGKEDMQKRLTGAINRVLNENEGFGGVDAVHFRSFLVQ